MRGVCEGMVSSAIRRAVGGSVLFTLIACTLIVLLLPANPIFPSPGLDPSWKLGLGQALVQGLDFGKGVVFTYGPYAAIDTLTYTPRMYLLVVLAAVYLCICYVVALWSAAKDTAWYWVVLFCGLAALFSFWRDALLFSYAFIVTIFACGYSRTPRTTRGIRTTRRRGTLMLVVSALGLLPLIKGSLLLLSAPVLAVCVVVLWTDRRWLDGVLAILSAVLAMTVFWCVSRQPLGNLLPFLSNTLAVSAGYTGAMSLRGSSIDLWWFFGAFVPAAILATTTPMRCVHRAAIIAVFLLIVFLGFKAGFVRHDGHALAASQTVMLLAALIPFAGARRHVAFGVVMIVITALCSAGLAVRYSPRVQTPLRSIVSTYRDAYDGITARLHAHESLAAEYRQALAGIARSTPLPKVAGTSDIYPTDIAALVASGNTWNPRPVFQSFSAYTPKLQRLNVAHLESPEAPTNIFFKLQAIDGRLPSLEDGASWPALLVNYAPTRRASGFLILQRHTSDEANPTLQPLTSARYRFNEAIPVPSPPGGPVFLSIDLQPSLLGRAAGFFYKLPELSITLQLRNGSLVTYRYIAGIGSSPFLVSPFVEDTTQFGLLYADPDARSGRDVVSVKIGTLDARSTAYWRPHFKVTTYALVNLPRRDVGRALGLVLPRALQNATKIASANTCEGVIDSIDQFPPTTLNRTNYIVSGLLSVKGWLASSTRQGTVPHGVYVTLSETGMIYYLTTAKVLRPDVAKYFDVPNMATAGYTVEADVAGLPSGKYLVGLAYPSNGAILRCPQFAYPVEVEAH